jgi:hypothetical protein
MSAQQVHQPAVFFRLRDIRSQRMLAFERDDPIQRLNEVGINPRTILRRCGKAELAIRSVRRMLYARWLAMIKQDFKLAQIISLGKYNWSTRFPADGSICKTTLVGAGLHR